MSPAGFEPSVPANERPRTHALDRAATGISPSLLIQPLIKIELFKIISKIQRRFQYKILYRIEFTHRPYRLYHLLCACALHILYFSVKPTDALNSKFILVRNSTCFGQFLCPSSGVSHCTFGTGTCYARLTTACVQDQDGTEFYLKVIYYDARSYERKKYTYLVLTYVFNLHQTQRHCTAFICTRFLNAYIIHFISDHTFYINFVYKLSVKFEISKPQNLAAVHQNFCISFCIARWWLLMQLKHVVFFLYSSQYVSSWRIICWSDCKE
jgi:hypothetical protein